MAEQEAGMIFTQDGVPVRGAADYQKVLDSRWRFIEIEVEKNISVNLPAVSTVLFADRYYEKTTILNHNLGFVPMFETDIDPDDYTSFGLAIFADKKRVFIRRDIQTIAIPPEVVTGKVRVYNLPIMEEYTAPKEFAVGGTSPQSDIGIQFLEEGGGVDLGDVSPIGFSVDTRKKILSVHKHGLATINGYAFLSSSITAIDTGTDILTVASLSGSDIGWIKSQGQAVKYTPGDFSTFPDPLVFGGTYYVIPVDDTHIKLAASYSDAFSGIAINITSAGSLPATMRGNPNPSLVENGIFHDVGYPPTFLLAEVNLTNILGAVDEADTYIGPRLNLPPTRMTADDDYIFFLGVQALFGGTFGYVILKDPVEIAK